MSESKFTKGKWFSCCLKSTPNFVYDEPGETVICKPIYNQEMRLDMNIEEYRANALLISKAPELLEALQNTLELLYQCDPPKELYETYGNLFANYGNLIKEATEL